LEEKNGHPTTSIELEPTQVSSVEDCAKLLYSTSILDLVVTCCLQDHQDIRLGPRKIAEPDVDIFSFTSEAQSASHMVKTDNDLSTEAVFI